MKTFIPTAIIAVFLLCASAHAQSGIDKTGFYRANLYYEEGKYDNALKLYSDIAGKGYESANLYYNIGNCFYKKSDFPRAALFYERARRLAPSDADLNSNHELVISQLTQSYKTGEKNNLEKFIDWLYASFAPDGLAIFIAILNILLFSLLAGRLFLPAFKKQFFYLAAALFLLMGLGIYDLFSRSQLFGKEAVIIAEKANVKFEPGNAAVTHFTIYGGEKVILVEDKGQWLKVKRLDGKLGWIRKEELEII